MRGKGVSAGKSRSTWAGVASGGGCLSCSVKQTATGRCKLLFTSKYPKVTFWQNLDKFMRCIIYRIRMHPKLWSSWPHCHSKNQVSAAATHSLRHVNVWTPRHPSDPSRKTCRELGTEFLVPKSAEQYEENIMIFASIDLEWSRSPRSMTSAW